MRDSVEHRRWPPLGTTELDSWGVGAVKEICNHFSGIECMAGFDVEEALHQWSRLKRELSGQPFFVLPFRKFWEHVSAHYDTANRYHTVFIPIRLTLLILMDTSCCERGYSHYNRICTAKRPNLEVYTVRNLSAVNYYGPSGPAAFNAEAVYVKWLKMIAKGEGASAAPKRRGLRYFCERSWRAPVLRHELGLAGALLLSNHTTHCPSPPTGGGGDIREHETTDLSHMGDVPCRREDAAICMPLGCTAGRSSRETLRPVACPKPTPFCCGIGFSVYISAAAN